MRFTIFAFGETGRPDNMIEKIFILFIICFTSVFGDFWGQNSSEKFDQISIQHGGLTQNNITSIIQDSEGFMWFGTIAGLNKFNGIEITQYINNIHDSLSLSNNWITAICEDNKGQIWAGTKGGGLNILTKSNSEIRTLWPDIDDNYSLGSSDITSLLSDVEGNLWVGTSEGLNILPFNENNLKFDRYNSIHNDQNSLSGDNIKVLYQGFDGTIWIGTNTGLNKVTIRGNGELTFQRFTNDPDNEHSISSNKISSIYEDSKGRLWIGTDKHGLNLLTQKNGSWRFLRYSKDPNSPIKLGSNFITSINEDESGQIWIGSLNQGVDILSISKKDTTVFNLESNPSLSTSISNNIVQSIYKSKSGMMWVGTWGGGVDKLIRSKTEFKVFKHNPSDKSSLIKNSGVRSFAEDQDGNLWVGTHEGIAIYNRKSNTFTDFNQNKSIPLTLKHQTVYSIAFDDNSTVWMGTKKGLFRYDRINQTFWHYKHTPGNERSLSHNVVRNIKIDSTGNVWIATFNGLNKFNPINEKFTRYYHTTNSSSTTEEKQLYVLQFDRKNQLWVGGYEALYRFNSADNSFIKYANESLNQNNKTQGHVLCIYEDSSRNIWSGTYGGGLNKLDPSTGKLTSYSKDAGLHDDVIYSILEDQEGFFWLSTNSGIIKLNPNNFETFVYDVNDGLQSNEFNGGAYYKTTDGEMYLGGVGGFNSFYPEQIKENTYIPPIVLTAFKVFGTKIKLDKSISQISEIKIPYSDNFFAFEFAALDYLDPQKNQFAYKLDPFDKDWVYSGDRRYASYTNLKHGTYTFHVKGTNSDGIWNNEGTQVKIVITPPYWSSWWFKLLIILLGVCLIYILYKIIVTQIYNKQLKKEVAIQTSELHELNMTLEDNNAELEKLSIVARETGNGVFITDANGDVEWFNEGFSKLFGWSSVEEFIKHRGKNIAKVTGNSDVTKIIDECVREKKSVTYEGYNPTKDGKNLWVQATLTPIFDEEGELKKLMFVDSDITELKEAKETAENALKIQEQFIANTSHEIRTPINGVIGMTRQLLETPLNEEQTEYLSAIKESSGNLIHVVNDILDISKIRAGKIIFEQTPFRLSELFKTLKYTLQYKIQEKNIYFKTEIHEDVPSVLVGDPFRLNQILLNLIGNAIKFTSDGGVTLSAKVNSEKGNSSVIEFSIQDTGIGIKEDQVKYIFESFAQAEKHTTRKYGGTGLGLSISKSLVEQQNGTINVRSKLNEGSTFYFSLSFEHGDPNWTGHLIQQSQGIPADVNLKDLSILLIDDNKINQKIALFELNRWNAQTDVADNALDAYEKIKSNNYSLVLMDISMPNISGIEASNHIREEMNISSEALPIIAVTASALTGEKARCLNAGMNDYMSKPFDLVTLYHKLIKWGRKVNIPYEKTVKKKIDTKDNDNIVDLSYIHELAGGNLNYVLQMVDISLEQLPTYLEELNDAFEEKNWELLSEHAHKMKSVVIYFGGGKIHDILQDIELAKFTQEYISELPKSMELINAFCKVALEKLHEERNKLNQ